MILVPQVRRVCLVHVKVSFHNGHHGLLAEAYKLKINPYDGDLAVFVNKRRNAIKLLFADSNGLWVAYKHFHKGVIPKDFKFLDNPSATEVAPSTVARLIEGSGFLPK